MLIRENNCLCFCLIFLVVTLGIVISKLELMEKKVIISIFRLFLQKKNWFVIIFNNQYNFRNSFFKVMFLEYQIIDIL